jgi:L1 cell adhesion molecule like protein
VTPEWPLIASHPGGIFEVNATGGDTRLGGEDFDANVVKYFTQTFLKAHKDAKLTERAQRRLFAAAERAKRQLSSATQAEVEVEALADGHDFKIILSRAKFEELNKMPFESCLTTVKAVLKDAALGKETIDDVVLVGGSTRIPKIRELLSSFFGGKELCCSINPDEAVAYGAAVQAGVLSGGLAAAGGALAKASEQLVLMDVVPLSLGIETTGRVMSTIVKRNTAIPCRKSDTYTTEEDWQTEIDVIVYEGERASVDACNELGKFTITGLERAKRGEPQVVVTFDIDANGILSVTAVDKVTNARGAVTITSTTARNSKADVARMVADAEKYASADAALKQKVEARRMLEDLIFDLMDEESGASGKQQKAASEADEWLRSEFESLSVDQIHTKYKGLKAVA